MQGSRDERKKTARSKTPRRKPQNNNLSTQSFCERKTVVLRSDTSYKTARQSASEDHFRFVDDTPGKCRASACLIPLDFLGGVTGQDTYRKFPIIMRSLEAESTCG